MCAALRIFVSVALVVLRMAIQNHLREKRIRSFCAIPVDSTLTSTGCVGTSSLNLRTFFSFGSDFNFDR